MVHPYQAPYSHEPSQPSIPSPLQTFELSADEYRNIERLHLSLLRTLRRLHEISFGEPRVVGDLAAPKAIRDLLCADAPKPLVEPLGTPLFLTTEIILDEDRDPYIVSVDAHSARHWENLIAFDERNAKDLVEAIWDQLHGRPLMIIVEARVCRCYPTLSTVLQEEGATVIRRNMREAARLAEKALAQPDEPHAQPCIIEYPFMRGKKRQRRAIAKGADAIIQPFVHLSDQRILALLSRPMPEGVRDTIAIDEESCSDLDRVRTSIPDTRIVSADEEIPENYVIKFASPLTSQRVLGTVGEIRPAYLSILARKTVAQQAVPCKKMHVHGHGDCPLRLIVASYGGSILSMIGIARIPANGQPSRDLAVRINLSR